MCRPLALLASHQFEIRVPKGPAPELSRHQSPRSVYNPPSLQILVPRGTNDPYEIPKLNRIAGGAGPRIACGERAAPPHPGATCVLLGSTVPSSKSRGQGCPTSRDASPAQDFQWREWKADARATPAPGAASLIQTLVGHCTPWRGGASPGGGSGGRLGRAWLSLSRVPQGTPGHLQRSRTPTLPAPAVFRRRSPHPTQCQP